MDRKKGLAVFKTLGDIFIPMLPGFIVAGVSAGFASLIAQLLPSYQSSGFWYIIHTILSLVNTSFTTYLSAWVGYSAAAKFGGTAILGGMLGMITGLEGINKLSFIVESSILHAGSGGVMAVIFGAWLLCLVEKLLHRLMPRSVDQIFTPIFTLGICLVPYIFVLMPIFGVVSNHLCTVIEFLCSNENLAVSLVSGFVCAGLFLPFNLFGLHFGFIALYAMQLEASGSISLYPVLAMAGASQVGSGISVLIKSKKAGNEKLAGIAASGVLPGMLGVGTALMYGVTLPHPKAFLSSCLGAGFGGAFIVAIKVSSTGWGPSGLLALPLMTAGSSSALVNMLNYVMGLAIACIAGFIITNIFVHSEDIEN